MGKGEGEIRGPLLRLRVSSSFTPFPPPPSLFPPPSLSFCRSEEVYNKEDEAGNDEEDEIEGEEDPVTKRLFIFFFLLVFDLSFPSSHGDERVWLEKLPAGRIFLNDLRRETGSVGWRWSGDDNEGDAGVGCLLVVVVVECGDELSCLLLFLFWSDDEG